MNASIFAMLVYVSWMILLLGMLGSLRAGLTLAGKRAPNSFCPDGSDVSPFSVRLCRAHANCYESFPIIGGLLLLAIATSSTGITDGLAYYMIGARILQSIVHLISTSNIAVQIRFAFFLVQLGIAVSWLVEFVKLW
jgi:hypothetical protein